MNPISAAQALVQDEFSQVETRLRELPGLQPESLRNAVEIIVSSGGKRIRPLITLLITNMLGNTHRERAIYLASAVEMLHTSSLVHDDLIDGALVRRGASTLNAVWTPAATVLTGDYLFAYAAGLASKTDSVRVMSIFADTLGIIVGGELRQQFTDWALRSTREDYYPRIFGKTGSLFVLATTAAGVICGSSEKHIEHLRTFGNDLGNAFQVMDDILDFTADEKTLGKPAGSDLRRGLITLPTICYLEQNVNAHELDCALKGECDSDTYDLLVQKIRTSPAIHAAHNEAHALIRSAQNALHAFPDSPYKTALLDIAEYTVSRKV